jgi:hypothetical protein
MSRHALYRGKRGRLLLECPQEAANVVPGSLDLHGHPGTVVRDGAGEPEPVRQGVDEGPKAHALNETLHLHVEPHVFLDLLLSRGKPQRSRDLL